MLSLLLFLLAAGAGVVTLDWQAIRERLSHYRVTDRDIGVLIKQSLASGNVRIVAQVFSPDRNTLRGEELLKADEVADNVRQKFAHADRVEIPL